MSNRKAGAKRFLGMSLEPWILATGRGAKSDGPRGQVWVLGSKKKSHKLGRLLDSGTPAWQREKIESSKEPVTDATQADGPLWVVRSAPRPGTETTGHQGKLAASDYSLLRDRVGALLTKAAAMKLSRLELRLVDCSEEESLGVLSGLEMASYRFIDTQAGKDERALPELIVNGDSPAAIKKLLQRAAALASGTNLARHLVNLGAGELNTKTYADALRKHFQKSKQVSVEVWDEKKLKSEKMRLLLAVGASGPEKSKLVILKYRPPGAARKAPVAFVGKGVVFDTGGLDLKPAGAMRLMKKDMGGSAAVVGLIHALDQMGVKQPVDAYLALAENSVSSEAFRPGDVIQSRSGQTVEIHNTDAEGRLVMADALDLASKPSTGKRPRYVIDVSTLTGAIKVGLGATVAGLFSNSDDLSAQLEKASTLAGEPVWRMPLVRAYSRDLDSSFADLVNCTDGFGGAITAALFLEKFVAEGTEWAHFDIFAWAPAPTGALQDKGGSGQAVQLLARWLEGLK